MAPSASVATTVSAPVPTAPAAAAPRPRSSGTSKVAKKPGDILGIPVVSGYFDISREDLTSNANFDPMRTSFFGVRFNMTPDDFLSAFKGAPNLMANVYDDIDEETPGRKGGKRGLLIANLDHTIQLVEVLWPPTSTSVSEIVLLPGAADYLPGTSTSLLAEDGLDPESAIADFLGKPGTKKKEGDDKVGSETVPYPERHLAIVVATVHGAPRQTVHFLR